MRALSPASFCTLFCAISLLRAEDPNIIPSPQITATQEPPVSQTADGPAEGYIRICVRIDAQVKFEVLLGAERTAQQLFDGIGVHTRFACDHSREASSRAIFLRLADHTRPDLHKGALGFALPYARDGVRATVFYDRVQEVEHGRDGIILGHAMVHELGHVLKAQDTHEDEGIMRARWGEADFEAMRLRELYFDEADVLAIHRNLPAFLVYR